VYTRKKYSRQQDLFHRHKSTPLLHTQDNPVHIFISVVKLIHETTITSVHNSTNLFNLQKPLDFARNEFISYYSQKQAASLFCTLTEFTVPPLLQM